MAKKTVRFTKGGWTLEIEPGLALAYFENNLGTVGGMLNFENGTLVDYDGVEELPYPVADMIQGRGLLLGDCAPSIGRLIITNTYYDEKYKCYMRQAYAVARNGEKSDTKIMGSHADIKLLIQSLKVYLGSRYKIERILSGPEWKSASHPPLLMETRTKAPYTYTPEITIFSPDNSLVCIIPLKSVAYGFSEHDNSERIAFANQVSQLPQIVDENKMLKEEIIRLKNELMKLAK